MEFVGKAVLSKFLVQQNEFSQYVIALDKACSTLLPFLHPHVSIPDF
jgi:hypothetical protein